MEKIINKIKLNKCIYIILFITICFINIPGLKAEEYTCAYDFTTEALGILQIEWEYPIELTFNTDSKSINYPDGIFSDDIYFLDKLNNSNYTDEHIVESLNGGCTPNITLCVIKDMHSGELVAYGVFYEESNFYNLKWKNSLLDGEYYSLGKDYRYRTLYKKFCGIANFNPNDSSAEKNDGNFSCEVYDNIEQELESLNCNGQKCDLNQKKSYNNKVQQLKTFCNSVFQHANYGLSSCLNKCLNFENNIAIDSANVNECGFSERLINFIINISKWVRYIIPVAVIILGIIDFLRALSSDKDDGLKKAQGRFIRRVIAAALIFIVPFILEFIIEKMGFISDTCGII